MRTLLILGFCASAMVANAHTTQTDTVTLYVINGDLIKNFNGSQLRGKTIKTYFIDTTESWNNRVIVGHAITTTDAKPRPGQGIRITKLDETDMNPNIRVGRIPDSDDDDGMPLTIIDGVESPIPATPSDLVSISVFEPGTPEATKYGEKGKNGVMVFTTKSGSSIVNTIYVIDGKKSTEADMKAISQDKIKSIEVLKGGAAKKYTDDPNVGVVIVTTKKK